MNIPHTADQLIGTIDPDAKAAWLVALRDPNSHQTSGKLRSHEFKVPHTATTPALYGYCCLGLFAEKVAGCQFRVSYEDIERDELDENGDATGNVISVEEETDDLECIDDTGRNVNESELLSQPFADRYGITGWLQDILSKLNDGQTITYYNEDGPRIEAATRLLGPPTKVEQLAAILPGEARKAHIWQLGKQPFTSIADVIEKVPARA